MKRAVVLMTMLGLAGVGCDDDSPKIVVHDMAMKMRPDANLGVPIGGNCMVATDCQTGDSPQCLKKNGGTVGECSASCSTDLDCGTGNVCLFAQTGTPGVCSKGCQAATDCPDGLGCWISLGGSSPSCFPVDSVAEGGKPLVLNCDPTVAGCTFTGSALPGGCERQIYGMTGMNGVCRQGCDIGVDTCPKGPDGSPQACYYVDDTLDSTGMSTGDALKQPICQFFDPQVTAGAECLDPTSMNHYFNICPNGQQCESAFTTSSVTPDNLCHTLCYIGSFTPPDAGALSGDGGIAGPCPAGQNCSDVFGASSATSPGMPVGLCVPN